MASRSTTWSGQVGLRICREGYIGFQDEGRPVWYRNVRIKELKKGSARGRRFRRTRPASFRLVGGGNPVYPQYSNIPTFQHSNIPTFQHSNIPTFSSIPPVRRSLGEHT